MLQRKMLVGKAERERNKTSQHNRITNRSNFIDRPNQLLVVLNDQFKAALNEVPHNFASHDCGSMNLVCINCNAKHFMSEATVRNAHSFTSCCHKGKVFVPPLTQNSDFNTLYKGLKSHDNVEKIK